MPNQILIIGTDPPCPRCALLGEMVDWLLRDSTQQVSVHHVAYDSGEARAVAESLGLTPGTAKHVAPKAGLQVDWDHVYGLINSPPTGSLPVPTDNAMAAKWSPMLDEALRPCQDAARAAGILMTPVLVVDGRLCHEGSVPSLERVREWLGFSGGRS
ncbi:MAG: hypothetical protein GF331_19430 [Chitinivibrionales bacterium]|nr:hypothetical protein [Chitinivibrionales bacterium]